ncbi:tetratricopeptide repeat protein [Kutzneria buriramensis]|uniref:Tetratricopeptide repeat protein n=1 Tax=Kutzneria buriramensis TaxID=1045776 RepID=A0A3E0GY96_9PSEU|nr:tetratricopeptide repeat protein [Kutzneria buriramensis]REH34725.1 tetratricopeptide repeat protein [Kutzneria buriramensis]
MRSSGGKAEAASSRTHGRCATSDPFTLLCRGSLAGAYLAAGDLDRAIPMYQRALDGQLRVLGGDDPDTLISYNNLGAAYEAAGDLERAIPLYRQTLDGRVRVLGKDDPAHADLPRETRQRQQVGATRRRLTSGSASSSAVHVKALP